MKTFALIGSDLQHSFSYKYFNNKFQKEKYKNYQYINLEINNISKLKYLISKYSLSGLNITIPYKTSIIPFLDDLSKEAKIINAVNTIQINNGKIIGHNTDTIGFTKSIYKKIKNKKNALVLGNGGSAQAIKYSLDQLNINHLTVSRNTSLNYKKLTKEIIKKNKIIINCTPLGMFPNINSFPEIPYDLLTKDHLLFDLVYNPELTIFQKLGLKKNCEVINGLEMLFIQAEESWKIWNS